MSSRSRSRSRNRSTEAPRLNNFNVTESSRMFGGSTTLNTNKPNPFDDDDSDDDNRGEGMDATAMFMKGGGNNKGKESKPNPFDDSDDNSDHDGTIMTDSLIKAGQDTAQSSPDRNSPFDNKDNNSPSSLGANSAGNSASGGSNRVGPFNSPNNDNEYNSNEEEEDEGPLTPQDIEEWHSNSQKGSPDDDNAYHTDDEDDKDDELGGGDSGERKGGEKKGYYNLSKPSEHTQFMSNQTGSGLSPPPSSNGGDANKLSYVSEKSKESSDGSLNIQTHRTASSNNYGNDGRRGSDASSTGNGGRNLSHKSSNVSGIINTDLTSSAVSRGGGIEEEEQYASMQELIDDEQRSRASFTTSTHRRGKCGWCIDSTIGMKSTKRRKFTLLVLVLLVLGGIIGIVVWLTTSNKGEENIESNKNKEFESKDNPHVEILDTNEGSNNGTATDVNGGSGMKNETNNKDDEGKGTDFDGLDLTFTFTTDMPSLAPSTNNNNTTGGELPTSQEGSNSPTISTVPTPTVMGIDVMDNDDDDIFGTWSDDTSLSASQELNGTDVSIPTSTSVNNSTNSSDVQQLPEDDPSSYLNVTGLDDDMLSDINVISFNDTLDNAEDGEGSLSPTVSASPSSVGIPSLPTASNASDISYSPSPSGLFNLSTVPTISSNPTTSLSIYPPPPPSTNTTNLTTTVTESKLQITIPGNLTLSNLNTPTTVNEQELLIDVLERTIMDVMNQDVLVNDDEEEVIVKDVVILRINGVDVVYDNVDIGTAMGSAESDMDLELSGDSPPRVPSSESSMPSDPLPNDGVESDACILCPNGITAGDDYTPYINDGDTTTCKELVDITAQTFNKNDESCKGSMIMEVHCCPTVQENPCLLCGLNGLSIDKEDYMPFIIDDGDMMTCKVS